MSTRSKTKKRKAAEDELPSAAKQSEPSQPPALNSKPNVAKKRQKINKQKTDLTKPQSALLINPRSAPVPLPKIKKFHPIISSKKSANRSSESQENLVQAAARRNVNKWLQFAPTYRIPGVKLSELNKRPKNLHNDINDANATISRMECLQADACSAKFVDDESGETLVCVFSHRAPTETDIAIAGGKTGVRENRTTEAKFPAYPGSGGRTLKDLKKFKDSYWDGIPRDALQRYHESAQELHSRLPPLANERDIRHPYEKVMTFTHEPQPEGGAEYVRDGVGDGRLIGTERTGVTHLVHAWHQQAHPNHPMTHSQDMNGRGGCSAAQYVRRYFEGSRPAALYLSACFKVAFPDYYRKYKAAFEAGAWMQGDPGPWLGRAIVWKLPVKTHMDGLDEGPTAIFNVGRYSGGDLYLPDLGVKLEYNPGTVVIFLSGQLYHSVSEWKPDTQGESDRLTPGRVGNVFFFPKASFDELYGESAGWNWKTISGTLPDVGESKPELNAA